MQILIVITLSNDTQRTCSWNVDRVHRRDNEAVASFIRSVEADDIELTAVHIFMGGSHTAHDTPEDIRALKEI